MPRHKFAASASRYEPHPLLKAFVIAVLFALLFMLPMKSRALCDWEADPSGGTGRLTAHSHQVSPVG